MRTHKLQSLHVTMQGERVLVMHTRRVIASDQRSARVVASVTRIAPTGERPSAASVLRSLEGKSAAA
jgi:hypothetical protein